MATMNLIEELHSDHRELITSLLALNEALERHDTDTARCLVEEIDWMAGPHMQFEEHHLYPVLRTYFGAHVESLIDEHDAIVGSLEDLRLLLSDDDVPPGDTVAAAEWVRDAFIHAANCDGVLVFAERLDQQHLSQLMIEFENLRRQKHRSVRSGRTNSPREPRI